MIYHDGDDDFEGLAAMVEMTVDALSQCADEFDSIVVQGVSGQCVGFPAALYLNKPIVVLRKTNEDYHCGGRLLNRVNMGERVLFLDDFVEHGETYDRCREAVMNAGGKIVGGFLYRDGELSFDSLSSDFGRGSIEFDAVDAGVNEA